MYTRNPFLALAHDGGELQDVVGSNSVRYRLPEDVLREARERHSRYKSFVTSGEGAKLGPRTVSMSRIQFGDGDFAQGVAEMQRYRTTAPRPPPLPQMDEPVQLTRTLARTASMVGRGGGRPHPRYGTRLQGSANPTSKSTSSDVPDGNKNCKLCSGVASAVDDLDTTATTTFATATATNPTASAAGTGGGRGSMEGDVPGRGSGAVAADLRPGEVKSATSRLQGVFGTVLQAFMSCPGPDSEPDPDALKSQSPVNVRPVSTTDARIDPSAVAALDHRPNAWPSRTSLALTRQLTTAVDGYGYGYGTERPDGSICRSSPGQPGSLRFSEELSSSEGLALSASSATEAPGLDGTTAKQPQPQRRRSSAGNLLLHLPFYRSEGGLRSSRGSAASPQLPHDVLTDGAPTALAPHSPGLASRRRSGPLSGLGFHQGPRGPARAGMRGEASIDDDRGLALHLAAAAACMAPQGPNPLQISAPLSPGASGCASLMNTPALTPGSVGGDDDNTPDAVHPSSPRQQQEALDPSSFEPLPADPAFSSCSSFCGAPSPPPAAKTAWPRLFSHGSSSSSSGSGGGSSNSSSNRRALSYTPPRSSVSFTCGPSARPVEVSAEQHVRNAVLAGWSSRRRLDRPPRHTLSSGASSFLEVSSGGGGSSCSGNGSTGGAGGLYLGAAAGCGGAGRALLRRTPPTGSQSPLTPAGASCDEDASDADVLDPYGDRLVECGLQALLTLNAPADEARLYGSSGGTAATAATLARSCREGLSSPRPASAASMGPQGLPRGFEVRNGYADSLPNL